MSDTTVTTRSGDLSLHAGSITIDLYDKADDTTTTSLQLSDEDIAILLERSLKEHPSIDDVADPTTGTVDLARITTDHAAVTWKGQLIDDKDVAIRIGAEIIHAIVAYLDTVDTK